MYNIFVRFEWSKPGLQHTAIRPGALRSNGSQAGPKLCPIVGFQLGCIQYIGKTVGHVLAPFNNLQGT